MIQYYFLDFFGCATLACIADHLYLQLGLSHRIESMIGVEACWTGKTFQCVFSLRIWVRNGLVIHVMAAARGCCTCLQDTSRPVSVYGCILFWKSTFPKTRRGLMAAVVQACPSLHSRPRRFARSSSTGAIGRTETAAPSGQPRRLRRTKTRVWFQFVICFELFILFIIINYLSFLWYIYIHWVIGLLPKTLLTCKWVEEIAWRNLQLQIAIAIPWAINCAQRPGRIPSFPPNWPAKTLLGSIGMFSLIYSDTDKCH
jgi:hypothetical protein